MRRYVITTGAAFGLLALAHVLRIILEGWHVAKSPIFGLTTLGSVALCIWALYLLKK
ncbi:MAG: hypothetical protein ACRD2Z_18755 [Thermoanaerobaculia bacterium]